jgi:hypothetical protein
LVLDFRDGQRRVDWFLLAACVVVGSLSVRLALWLLGTSDLVYLLVGGAGLTVAVVSSVRERRRNLAERRARTDTPGRE